MGKSDETIRSKGRSPQEERSDYHYVYNVYYGITIKHLRDKYPPSYYYEEFIKSNINKKVLLQTYHYELDSKGKLHVHGLIECPSDYNTINLCRKGWKVHCDEIDSYEDLQRWSSYIQKDYTNHYLEEQMVDCYDIRHSAYPFI